MGARRSLKLLADLNQELVDERRAHLASQVCMRHMQREREREKERAHIDRWIDGYNN